MRRMTQGTEPLSAIPVSRDDEIGELIGNFNQLATERSRLDQSLRSEITERRHAQEELGNATKRLQALSEHISRLQDAERRTIAFELHEQLGQELSSLKLQLQMLEEHCVGDAAKLRLEDAREVAQVMLDRVRDMAFDLHPPQLDAFGLSAALRRYCAQKGEKQGWAMHFDVAEAQERPAREVEVACYRVTQEVLANVARHAQASEVWVSLQQTADELRLHLRDNGIGFDPVTTCGPSKEMCLGLMGLEERVRQVGGRIEFKSRPGGGTEVDARFVSQHHFLPARAPARSLAG
jgi:signal transduction histidine kinase